MADQRPGDKAFGESVPQQGATGIFGFVEDDAKAAERPSSNRASELAPDLALTAQIPAAAPTTLEGSGFTQLLRALTHEASASPAVASSVGVTSPPADAMPPKASPIAPSPGGFTEMFGALGDSGKSAPPQRSLSGSPSISSPLGVSDGFTGAFGAVASASESSSVAGPVFSSSSATGRSPSVEASASSPGSIPAPAAHVPAPAAETQSVGEFTRLFQALDSKPAQAAPVFSSPVSFPSASAPAAVPPSGTPVGSDSGGFTQLLRAFDAGKGPTSSPAPEIAFSSPAPAPAPQAPVAPAASALSESPGSFTQLFQALGPVPGGSSVPGASSPMPPPQQQEGDGFTRSFLAFDTPVAQNTSQADSFPPIAPSHASVPSYPGPDASSRVSAPRYPDTVYTPPSPMGASSPGGGSLDDILRALESPSKSDAQPAAQSFSNAPYVAPQSYPTPMSRESPPPQGMPQNQYAYPAPAAAVTPMPQSAAGGVTSIINASQLREMERMARQGGASPQPAGPTATPPYGAPALSSMPPMQYPSAPASPPMPSYPPAMNPAQGGSWPMPLIPAPVAPPQIPQMSAPAATASAAPQAGAAAKAWLPILLIVIIVLLVGILLAVLLIKK